MVFIEFGIGLFHPSTFAERLGIGHDFVEFGDPHFALLDLGFNVGYTSGNVTLQDERTIYTVECQDGVWRGRSCEGSWRGADREGGAAL